MAKTILKNVEAKPKFVETLDKLTLREEWPKYKLATYDEWQKNEVTGEFEKTNYISIRYNGRFVNHMTKLYKVLPNEDVIRTADLVAKRLKFDQFQPKPKNHNVKFGWCKVAGNVIENPERTQIIAHYNMGEKFDVTGAGDYVQPKFAIKNAIDGKGGSFSVMPCSFRGTCNNIAYHMIDLKKLHSGLAKPKLGAWLNEAAIEVTKTPELKKAWEEIDHAKANFQRVGAKKPHFQTLTLEYVTHSILTVVEAGEELMQKYKIMYKEKVSQKICDELVKALPKSISNNLTWLEIDKKTKKVSLKKSVNKWQAFNDVTNKLTFGGKRNFNSTIESYKKLDEILVQPIIVKS